MDVVRGLDEFAVNAKDGGVVAHAGLAENDTVNQLIAVVEF